MNFGQIQKGLFDFWTSFTNLLPIHSQDWQIDFRKLANIDYYFNGTKATFRFAPHLTIILSIFLVMGLIALIKLLRSKAPAHKKRFLKRLSLLLFTSSVLGFVFLFLRYEGAKFLNMRFWWVLLLVSYFIWSIRLGLYYFRTLPKLEEEYRVKILKSQYLPKKKKRAG